MTPWFVLMRVDGLGYHVTTYYVNEAKLCGLLSSLPDER